MPRFFSVLHQTIFNMSFTIYLILLIFLFLSACEVKMDEIDTIKDQKKLIAIANNHSSESIREAAVAKITDQSSLIEIAINNNSSRRVRREALNQLKISEISDQKTLSWIALSEFDIAAVKAVESIDDQDFLIKIVKKLSPNSQPWKTGVKKIKVANISDPDLLSWIAISDSHDFLGVGIAAVEKLTDQKALVEVAKNNLSEFDKVGSYAIDKISDQNGLIQIVKSEAYGPLRKSVVTKIIDPIALADIAKNDKYSGVRSAAISNDNFNDQAVLEYVYKNDSDDFVKCRAIEKLTDPELLLFILKNDQSLLFRKYAAENKNLTGQEAFIEIAKEKSYGIKARLRAIEHISSQKILTEIAKNETEEGLSGSWIAESTIKKITNRALLIEIAKESSNLYVWPLAVKKLNIDTISDMALIHKIVKNPGSSYNRYELVNKVTDEKLLIELAQKDTDLQVQRAAINKISNLQVLLGIASNDSSALVRNDAFCRIIKLKEKTLVNFSRCSDVMENCDMCSYIGKLKLLLEEKEILAHHGRLKFFFDYDCRGASYTDSCTIQKQSMVIRIINDNGLIIIEENDKDLTLPGTIEGCFDLCADIDWNKIYETIIRPLKKEDRETLIQKYVF